MPKLSPWSCLVTLVAAAGLAAAQGPPEDKERTFVLIVGVEDYADPKITDLSYAEDDAQAVYDFFAEDPRSPTTKDRVKLLLGKQATRIDVLSAIEEHLARRAVGPRDTAILYFAGHGFSDTQGVYLATSDTRLGKLRYSAVSWAELQRLWSQIGAGRRILLADACHSGGIEGLRGPGGIAKRALAVKIAKPNFASVVIAATGANELSMEDKNAKHGVFTAALLGGLRGSADKDRDGNVSLGELTGYLTTQVPRAARKAGGTQTPTIRFNGSEPFARRLRLSRGKPLEVGAQGSELARVRAERKAAERERELAELRSQVAEAKLKKLRGASAEEVRQAQAEAAQAKTDLAKAQAAAQRVREEEVKRIAAEKRAVKAEAEAAELRRQLAELKGNKAAADLAAKQAAAARKRERELGGHAAPGPAQPQKRARARASLGLRLGNHEKGLEVVALRPGGAAARAGVEVGDVIFGIHGGQLGGGKLERIQTRDDLDRFLADYAPGDTVTMTLIRSNYTGVLTMKLEGPIRRRPTSSASAIERAKRLKDFAYLDTRTFECGGQKNTIARFKHAKTGLIFHLLPGGTYTRGSESGPANEKPVREVTIQPFLICATECTQAAWKQVMGTDPSSYKGAQRPVETVSWDDSQSFSSKAGLRLPSEAEWEYACRAGTTTEYGFGDSESELGVYALFNGNNNKETQPVGGKRPNAFGLFDVHGNVWEWCQDAYQDSYTGAPTDGSARDTAGASRRVFRGGSIASSASRCRSAYRYGHEPGGRDGVLGFRPAKSLP
jgi:formylglycine-generating enzyme required for sulfatase activity